MPRLAFQTFVASVALNVLAVSFACGQESSYSSFRPVPTTRPMMKQLIEDMKYRKPRIPMPVISSAEKAELGERASSYEALLRYKYLGQKGGGYSGRVSRSPGASGPSGRAEDPESTLSYAFKVQLFWIVSRTNNCQYCIGHQESKLLAAGVTEDTIAAMDCDWSIFTEKERAAFEFARTYTLRPYALRRSDIEHLKQYFSDSQILEMCLSMGWNNAINRWKEGIGVPQSADEGGYSRLTRELNRDQKDVPEELKQLPSGSYLTITSSKFRKLPSIVAPVEPNVDRSNEMIRPQCIRPNREPPEEVAKVLDSIATREPALQLMDADTTRKRLQLEDSAPVANWMRLLCRFPTEGVGRAQRLLEMEQYDELSMRLRSQIAWIVARQDRAWYALATAQRKLLQDGLSQEQIMLLDGDWAEFTAKEKALFVLATHLAASPVVLTDEEVATAIAVAGPKCVVQTIDYVTQLAAFDRITEAAQLPIEPAG